MSAQELPFVGESQQARLVHVVRPAGLDAWLAGLPAAQAHYLRDTGFAAKAQELRLIPGAAGIAAAVLGAGDDRSPFAFGALPLGLPEGDWKLADGDYDFATAVLGFGLGAYHYARFRAPKRPPARLVTGPAAGRAPAQVRAAWLARDLINTPANLLGPAELAAAAVALATAHTAQWTLTEGAELESAYPTIAAVGRGSVRPPVVAAFRWQGSTAGPDAPLVALCGKGVCFDTGGYDLKPAAAMLRMKKDMGGAASVLALAAMLMDADLPLRLVVRLGCVENAVSGTAMRPQDVIRTRRGLHVEVGNTDAEGRLVLCDLLAEASDEAPALLLDCATLTGAARVAVGPDLPALFTNDDAWAAALARAGAAVHDPLWRLPLWDGYDSWLDSPVADLNNVATKPMAGAIIAALFMRRFIAPGTPWVHFDLYAWNDSSRPGRPEGGEVQAMRAACAAIETMLLAT
ncbi:MAG: leucyl aminopeptidase family protein [Acetobacteraceae bacterium]|nr:leucyl aminopeptidase family protein [Acetobacteraceae bacterium]